MPRNLKKAKVAPLQDLQISTDPGDITEMPFDDGSDSPIQSETIVEDKMEVVKNDFITEALMDIEEPLMTEAELAENLKGVMENTTEPAKDENKGIIVLDASTVVFDINQAQIDEYKKLVPKIIVKDHTDRENYGKAYDTRIKLKNARLNVEKKVDATIVDAKKFIKEVKSRGDVYIDQITPLEADLKKQEVFFETEKERIRKEEEEAQTKRIHDRTAFLLSNGCTYDGVKYQIEDTVIKADDLGKISDADFKVISEGITVIHEQLIEKERIRKEEEERLQAELQAKRDEVEKQNQLLKDSMAALQKQIIDFRVYQVKTIGMQPDEIGYVFRNDQGEVHIGGMLLKDAGATDWEKAFSDTIASITKLKQQQLDADELAKKQAEESTKQADVIGQRSGILVQEGFTANADGSVSFEGFSITAAELGGMSESAWKQSLDICKNVVSEKKARVELLETRKASLRKIGLVVEELPMEEGKPQDYFVYHGTNVHEAIAPDNAEKILAKSDEDWNVLLAKIANKVTELKAEDIRLAKKAIHAEQELLTTPTAPAENTESDLIRLGKLQNSLSLLIIPDMDNEERQQNIVRIREGISKMEMLVEHMISTYSNR